MTEAVPPPALPQAPALAAPAPSVAGERHVSAVAGNGGFTKRQGTALLVAATGAALAFVLLRPQSQVPADTKSDDNLSPSTPAVRKP